MEETLTALLAGVAGGRRYWVRAPQSAPRPYILMTRIGGVRDYAMQGPSGYVASRVQIDCYADSYTAAKAIGRDAMEVLSGHRGGSILGIFIDSERDLPAADAGEVTHLFRVSIDLNIHHQEN
ncbi:DUF3168 domain-containing protein [Hoeflea sp.]|uniref:tail completion protein gp17 n=1 Tax=Hoeflea sp. TaxID=1940281 RepID=UPI002AFFC782|nr:DUF3168 domain-containing protein [Hoeflea sp.]